MKRSPPADPRLAITIVIALAGAACQHVPPAPLDPSANAARIAARSLRDPAVSDALARHGLPVADGAWTLDQLTLA
ncbi:MAG TPA: hypothetical protein VFO94_17025, partial [Gammaproteobacteria bacterium]|nr:hypothetical protein [Gammaproteobacteria bacterium]